MCKFAGRLLIATMASGGNQPAINNNSMSPRRSITTSGASRFYLTVLAAIACGVLLGYFWPSAGVALKPFADGFLALIKMLIAPLIFFTVVLAIASGTHARQVGRVALKGVVYFGAG